MTEADRTTRRKVSVVVPTCANAATVERALTSIIATGYEPLEIIVVENRPPAPDTRRLMEQQFGTSDVHYVEEPRRGASWARDAGLAAATGDLVAFADDDVVVHPDWIDMAIAAFDQVPDAACVTGRILPLAFDTSSQRFFDQLAALDKGTERRVFRLPESLATEPLFPYAAGHVGSGANIFVLREAAVRLQGFDPRLGPGTPTFGGEDLDVFVRLAQAGHAIVYEPAVVVWHEHPSSVQALRRHAFRYGVGLTAMLTKQVHRGPTRRRLLKAIPAGLKYGLDPNSRKNVLKSADYPRGLDALERLGMIVGPAMYAASLAVAAARSVWRSVRHRRRGQAAGC